MKVILQKDVPNLGDAGEIKDVASGYARNYLLPRKLVVPAQAGSQRALEHHKRLMALQAARRNAAMQQVSTELAQVGALEISVRVGSNKKMFGSVTTAQIAQLLAEKGFELDKRKIEVGEKIRSLGNYQIKVRLAEKIVVPLDLRVVADAESEAAAEEEAAEVAAMEARAAAQKAAAEAAERGETLEPEASEDDAGADEAAAADEETED
jgi:large subunit ribosomal protein L9